MVLQQLNIFLFRAQLNYVLQRVVALQILLINCITYHYLLLPTGLPASL